MIPDSPLQQALEVLARGESLSADATAAAVEANGGRVLSAPIDIPRSGRVALCADPAGATIGLWQPAENRGVQVVNAPGSWNFSELQTADPDGARAFYGAVFGWECDAFEMGPGATAWLWRMPGYGAFLAESDPGLRERLEEAGYRIDEDVQLEGYRRFHVRDPFGNRLELVEPA